MKNWVSYRIWYELLKLQYTLTTPESERNNDDQTAKQKIKSILSAHTEAVQKDPKKHIFYLDLIGFHTKI